jgi:hypothetical protein
MSDSDWSIDPDSLTLPPFAAPGDPAIVLGPDIPPELVAWGSTRGVVFFAVQIFRFDATRYRFQAIGTFAGQVTYFEGTFDPNNLVYITSRTLLPGGTGVNSVVQRIGSSSLDTFDLVYNFQQTDVQINDVSQGRGLATRVSSLLNTAAIGAETLTLSTGAMTWASGRAYACIATANILGNVANNESFIIFRRNNIAGAIKFSANFTMSPVIGNTVYCFVRCVIINTGASVSDNICITQQTLGGGTTTAQGGGPRALEVWDIGAASDFPNSTNI